MNKGFNQNNMNMPNMPRDTEEYMYPEVYQQFFPVIEQLIKEMEQQYGDIYLSEDLLDQMIEEAIRRSGLENIQPSSNDIPDGDAVQTMNEFNRYGGRDRGRDRNRWKRYDRSALSDIYRILILQQLFGRRRPRWRCR